MFEVAVGLGFLFWFIAALPTGFSWFEAIGRGFFLAAALVWAGVLH